MGYTGGKEANPTYKSILDSTEAVLIEYDPKLISFEDILQETLKQHNPFVKVRKRQYRSAIWVQNKRQRNAAMSHIQSLQRKHTPPRKVHIDVEELGTFYRAEEYHQDFLGKHMGVFD